MTEPGTKALLIRIGRLEAAIQIQEEELDRLRAENERLRGELGEYDTDGSPIGWTIVGVATNSILCQDKTGARRRYWTGESDGLDKD